MRPSPPARPSSGRSATAASTSSSPFSSAASDVLDPGSWRGFLEEAFGRFAPLVSAFEVGHAWNRTKWGVWDHREYLRLAEPAFELAPRFGAKLAGPAVIDFEFHLYPVTLPRLPFDAVTSLLYVDRMGAPENGQCGWTAAKKLALLKAAVDTTARRDAGRGLWITEVNWPLAGTGAFSPASGKPNVSEDEQADFLVRYYVPFLASGLVERIYWWQLVAPGYGLVDDRESPWRRRPAFRAFAELRARLEGSVFEGHGAGGGATEASGVEVFRFRGKDGRFAVCWAPGGTRTELVLPAPAAAVLDREGREIPRPSGARSNDHRRWEPEICPLRGINVRPRSPSTGRASPITRGAATEASTRRSWIAASDGSCAGPSPGSGPWIPAPGPPRPGPSSSTRPAATAASPGSSWERAPASSPPTSPAPMVERAVEGRDRARHLGGVAADLRGGLPFKSAAFGYVFSMRLFHHLHGAEDRRAVLREFARVASGGVVMSFYRFRGLHALQRRLRRLFKPSHRDIKMMAGETFEREAAEAGFTSTGSIRCSGASMPSISWS